MAVFTGDPVVVGDPSTIHDTETNKLGTRASDSAGNEYIFLKGVASTVAGSWVSFDELFVTTLLVANAVGRVGIAQAATVAGKYGWYLIYGSGTAKCLTLFADNGKVYTTATAGSVDDAVVATELVIGAIGRSAESSLSATFEVNYPFVTDALG